jgi:hypothetical protein
MVEYDIHGVKASKKIIRVAIFWSRHDLSVNNNVFCSLCLGHMHI